LLETEAAAPNHQPLHQGKTMRFLALLPLIFTPFCLHAQTLAGTQLSALFVEETFLTSSQICAKRFPESRTVWTDAFTAWREKNQVELDAFRDLVARLNERFKGPDIGEFGKLPGPIVAFEFQSLALQLAAYGSATDPEAKVICKDVMEMLSDPRFSSMNFDRAKQTAEAILAVPMK
jgi:hypothetical protein